MIRSAISRVCCAASAAADSSDANEPPRIARAALSSAPSRAPHATMPIALLKIPLASAPCRAREGAQTIQPPLSAGFGSCVDGWRRAGGRYMISRSSMRCEFRAQLFELLPERTFAWCFSCC